MYFWTSNILLKIKTVTNKFDVLGGAIGYTLLNLFWLGGFFLQYKHYSAILIFLLIEGWMVYKSLRAVKTVTFYSDRIEVNPLIEEPFTINLNDGAVELSLMGGSKFISQNSVALLVKKRGVMNFKLNDHEWELEEFYHNTRVQNGMRWRIHESKRPSFKKNYELYLKRKGYWPEFWFWKFRDRNQRMVCVLVRSKISAHNLLQFFTDLWNWITTMPSLFNIFFSLYESYNGLVSRFEWGFNEG